MFQLALTLLLANQVMDSPCSLQQLSSVCSLAVWAVVASYPHFPAAGLLAGKFNSVIPADILEAQHKAFAPFQRFLRNQFLIFNTFLPQIRGVVSGFLQLVLK